MLHGFNLKITESEIDGNLGLSMSVPDTYEIDKNIVQGSLRAIVERDGIINGDKMSREWFPLIKGNHVFISHSHRDIRLAKKLALWLRVNFGIKSFIDSMVWSYADDLLAMIDDEYCKTSSGDGYLYERRNISTSNVYISLVKALDSVIDSCECLIFINTDQSTESTSVASKMRDGSSSFSPWIMSELRTSEIIRRKQEVNPERRQVDEGGELFIKARNESEGLAVSYNVPIKHLNDLSCRSLLKWQQRNQKYNQGYDALTELYNHETPVRYEVKIYTPAQR